MRKLGVAICSTLAALALPGIASADYNETSGDLSGDHTSPTPITVTPDGFTNVTGSVAGTGMGHSTDLDYFRFTVPPGQFLTGLFVRTGTTTGGTGSFIGLFSGTSATDPATTTGANMLGYYLYKTTDVDNILDDMATFNFQGSNPSQMVAPPHGPGDYTLWIQEGSNGTFNYNLDLQLSSVPEPTTAALLLGGASGLLAMRRRRRAGMA